MKNSKHKEYIQRKLYSMASILMGNIIIPSKEEQEGTDSIVASWYDEYGNKYSFTLSLNIVPPEKVDTEADESTTITDQIATILLKLDTLEGKVDSLEQNILKEPTVDTGNNDGN